MKKFYVKPEIVVECISSEDIMYMSDTFVDMEDFWSDTTTVSE